MKRLMVMSVGAAALLMACPPTGVVCKPGTLPCGTGCIDPTSDRRNCGACGKTCLSQQDCLVKDAEPVCACRAGTTACPDGVCVVTDYDAKNCGQCGVACAQGQVCERGACQASCSTGLTRCGASCVDASNDVAHCGGCALACAQGQRCVSGTCEYEAVAACYWSGQLVGFDPATGVKGPLSDVGSNPGALARVGSTVLAADGTDRRLYTALPTASGAYAQGALVSTTGAVPNQVLVERPFVYVVNAGSGTLLVLREGADAGVLRLDAGVEATLVLGAVAELPLGMNSFPQGAAKVGSRLFVPLYGGYGAEAADAGQEVAVVDVSDPTQPALNGRVSLKGLDLRPFDGGAPVARPWAVVAQGGSVFVALNNLNPDTYAPEGPGLLARVEPDGGPTTVVDLGAECLNPQWVAVVGSGLAVSCGGRISYSPTFVVESVEAAGVVMVDSAGALLPARWAPPACAADAGCMPLMPGRFVVAGQQVLLADQNGGRVVVLEVSDAGVTEAGAPLNLCPVSPVTGVANVADLVTR